ncbi:hypothetical protein J4476_04900 [Candidatus Woesearchaeota archaeon]|nr:MAG: hypothetical protein QT09_C0004G0045 [archaeon GW2011_AR18]MBS3162001.1 hypothetical protein [Candidatus Woesearchaeota archaeon]HIH25840.1 hypothetical protein [Nanoarchaeota archaeon]
MTKIDDMEFHLDKIESFVNDIKYKLQSKQSERVLSSHVWMSDSIEKTINNSVKPFMDSIKDFKSEYEQAVGPTVQFDFIIKHSNELNKHLNNLNSSYKNKLPFSQISPQLNQSIPEISSNLNSLRNRFNILKGNMKRFKLEDESLF